MRYFWSVILTFPPSAYSFYFKLKTWHLGFFFIFIPEITAHVLRSMSTRLYVPLYNISNAWQVRSFDSIMSTYLDLENKSRKAIRLILYFTVFMRIITIAIEKLFSITKRFLLTFTLLKLSENVQFLRFLKVYISLTFKTTKDYLNDSHPHIKCPNCPNGIAVQLWWVASYT